MTGTGTQTDPYIVSVWSDFIQAIAINGAYVKCADDGGTFDVGKYYRYGGSETIYVRAAVVDGNGWIIKNLYVLNRVAFHVYGKIKNLNFIDFNVLCTLRTARLIVFYTTDNLIENCIFTGEVSGKYDGSAYAALVAEVNTNDASRILISRCAFNLKVSGGISINGGNNVTCSNCIFDVDSSDNSTNYPFYNMNFKNCLVRGAYQNLALAGGFSKYSILDVDCPSIISGGSKSHFIIGNSDKASYNANYFYTATTEQLKNAEYLHSIGFPIGNGKMEITDISEFEQGGFYVDSGQDYSGSREIRSGWMPFNNTAVTVECGNLVWSFICRDSDGVFHKISESSGYKSSGETIDLTAYSWIAEIRIELSGSNKGMNISPPQTCTLYNGYPWKIDSKRNDGLPFPTLSPEPLALGAFANAVNLVEVSIPRSVKKIGRESFRNTQLTSVTIASDCTYYPTSFPQGCTVNFYPD